MIKKENKTGIIRLCFIYIAIGLAVIAHFFGILYAGLQAGFLAGKETFENVADEAND